MTDIITGPRTGMGKKAEIGRETGKEGKVETGNQDGPKAGKNGIMGTGVETGIGEVGITGIGSRKTETTTNRPKQDAITLH